MTKRVILALSDYAATGIGESLLAPLRHWHDQGHEIWYLGLGYTGICAEVDKQKHPWAERMIPMMDPANPQAKFGQASLHRALAASQADTIITAFDVGMIRYFSEPHQDPHVNTNKQLMDILNIRRRKFTHIAYFPLDGLVDDGALPRHFDEMIAGMDLPVTYSDFSKQAILRNTGFDIPMVPISHDPNVFKPMDQKEARRAVAFPENGFIMSMVATNQSRKLWPEFIKAASRVARRHSDAYILPWTTWNVQINGGFDIPDLIYRNGVPNPQVLNPGNAVHRFTEEMMAQFYNAIDVCVLTSVGEGAGLPPIRARACRTATLVSDNTACGEFAAHEFEKIPSFITHVDNGNNLLRYGSDVDVLEERLEQLYESKSLRDEIAEAGYEFTKQFEVSRVNPKWDAVLEMI